VALVTGASRGIGRAIALRLAEEGCDVAINYHSSQEAAMDVLTQVHDMGRKGDAFRADVASADQVGSMVAAVEEGLGPVDILVNNAGIHKHHKSWEMSVEDWDRIIGVNLTGAYLTSRLLGPAMARRGWGRIINISSVVADVGSDHEAHYTASKAGMHGLTKSLALELSPKGVTVNAVAPGWIRTDMTADVTDEEWAEALEEIPLGRIGEPEEIASVVAYLASPESGYVTGQVLHVNGGVGLY
jgi:NAD(P)-dependent dehydrogenase (short-subunit alcohol dehydrogenase family)